MVINIWYSLVVCRRNVEEVFIFKFLLLFVFTFSLCDGANRNGGREIAVSDSTKKTEGGETTKPQDKSINRSDSFLNVLNDARKIHLGDFDTMLKRRIIRVLVPYSRTLFFNDKGVARGLSADNFR